MIARAVVGPCPHCGQRRVGRITTGQSEFQCFRCRWYIEAGRDEATGVVRIIRVYKPFLITDNRSDNRIPA